VRCWAHKRKERRVALGATVRPAVDVKTPRTLFLGAPRAFFVSVPVIVSFACVLRPACLLKDAPLAGKSPRTPPEPGFSSKAPGPRPLGFTGPPYEPRGGYRSLLGRVRELTRVTVRTRAARTDEHSRLACASRVTGGDSSASNSLKKQKSALFPIQKSRPKFTKYLRALVKEVEGVQWKTNFTFWKT